MMLSGDSTAGKHRGTFRGVAETLISKPEMGAQYQEHIAESLSKQGLKVLRPNEDDYAARQNSYWCNIAKELTPALIVCPTSAEQVSIVIKALAESDQAFAIRSGGHAPFSGVNNIEGGVTIDLSRLTWVRFDPETETVDLGPGGLWSDVYNTLAKHGRVVSGGRDGTVGVGGLIMGGGYSFFMARRGFACDDVVEFEVVLADGSIVTATAHDREDLYKVLKGGSNNFGIVTNIRMNVFKCQNVWGGLNFFTEQTTPGAIEALVDFTKNCHNEEDSHLLFFFTYIALLKQLILSIAYVQVAGIERAPAYNKFLSLTPFKDTTKLTTVAAVVSEYDIAPSGFYNTFYTVSVKNDTQIITEASKLHGQLPLKRHFSRQSANAGGNILGIENQPVDGLLLVLVVMVSTREQDAFARSKTEEYAGKLTAFASTFEHGILPWVYMNYADRSQKVLQSYGEDNVKKMKEVAVKYDPDGVFQRLCPGGFKLADVKDWELHDVCHLE
ncbi:hypothetical protein EKO27_g8356 [Xylaria grammica]|uniref:FAD-binding PCMH-type domain-containing protein n=1 Tax=Xylaria grammica TaxID=363999 RepID=A0A439CX03_9PEZI|nr:hypothetical protein EKO27_g8356 [Xylaria grammica]